MLFSLPVLDITSYLIDNEVILFIENIVKYSLIVDQVWNYIGFMPLHNSVCKRILNHVVFRTISCKLTRDVAFCEPKRNNLSLIHGRSVQWREANHHLKRCVRFLDLKKSCDFCDLLWFLWFFCDFSDFFVISVIFLWFLLCFCDFEQGVRKEISNLPLVQWCNGGWG